MISIRWLILWWLIITPLLIFAIRKMFDNQITLGDLLAFCIPITIAFLIWFFRWLYYRNNFSIIQRIEEWEYDPTIESHWHENKKVIISVGKSELLIIIRSKSDVEIEFFSIYLNTEKKAEGHVSVKTIKIDSLNRPPESRPVWDKFESHPDNVGHYQGYFNPPKRVMAKSPFYFQITINAKQKWTGHLVFYAPRKIGGRGYAYLPIEVTE